MKSKPVEIYNNWGKLLTICYSINATCEELHLTRSVVDRLLRTGQINNKRRIKFMGQPFGKEDKPYKIQRYKNNDIENFYTIIEAAEITNINRNYISNYIKYHTQDEEGYSWKKI